MGYMILATMLNLLVNPLGEVLVYVFQTYQYRALPVVIVNTWQYTAAIEA